jgi:hypothetical protein
MNSPICTLCGESVVASQHKAFPMCSPCFEAARDLDMTVARKLKFEPADFIVDNIYLGGEGSTIELDYLVSQNITRILTVAAHMDRMIKHEGIEYLQIDIDDHPSEDLRAHWETSFSFIRTTKSNVLVHCVSGISRSGATVVAYVMAAKGCAYFASASSAPLLTHIYLFPRRHH